MLKQIKGQDWGASSKLILTTYKTLVRPIIDYVPFATITMDPTYQLMLERVQRAAIRVALHWPMHTTATEMYQRVRLEPILERAFNLSLNYLKKIVKSDSVVRDTFLAYLEEHIRDDGAYWKANKRPTLIYHLKEKYLANKAIAAATNTDTSD